MSSHSSSKMCRCFIMHVTHTQTLPKGNIHKQSWNMIQQNAKIFVEEFVAQWDDHLISLTTYSTRIIADVVTHGVGLLLTTKMWNMIIKNTIARKRRLSVNKMLLAIRGLITACHTLSKIHSRNKFRVTETLNSLEVIRVQWIAI